MLLATENQSGGGGYTIWIMMALLFVGMYFLMIRPQQRRRREMESMQRGMGPGDEVVTVGGLHGIVESLDDTTVQLQVAPGVSVTYERAAVTRVVNPAVSADEDLVDDDVSDVDPTRNGGVIDDDGDGRTSDKAGRQD